MAGSQVLRRGDEGYDDARRVWNAMVGHRSAVIVRCAGVGDVQEALRLAREQGLEVGVRSGGHTCSACPCPTAA